MVDHPNAILEDKIAEGYISGPEFLTGITPLAGGYESRNMRRAVPRWRFDFSIAELDVDQVKQMLEFYVGRRGPAFSWLIKDFWDCELIDETILVATGGETTAQVTRTYDKTGNPYAKNVKYIKTGTLAVYIDGVLDSGATHLAGLVTFSGALSPGDVVTIGSPGSPTVFYKPVRFKNDFAGLQMQSRSANWGSLPNFDAQEELE